MVLLGVFMTMGALIMGILAGQKLSSLPPLFGGSEETWGLVVEETLQEGKKSPFLKTLRLVIAMWCLEKGVIRSRGRPYGEIAVTKPPQGNLLQSFVTDVAWTGEIGEGGW